MTQIAIVGEAWGEREELERTPFVGPSGYELTKMLSEAGIRRADCFLTNVINARPPGNKIEAFCGSKADGIPGFPYIAKGKYLRKEFFHEIQRLGSEIVENNPNLIICLGNTALWAFSGLTAISKNRGTTRLSTHTVADIKLLPTYHPAAILRQWELRPTTVIDLLKAARESQYPEIRRPKRSIWIEPTLDDLEVFYREYILPASILSVDIETSGTQITCIGFAPSRSIALVVPFHDSRKAGRSYWGSLHDEQAAWRFVKRTLESPRPEKLFQNGMFDMAVLWRSYGIAARGAEDDTMLLHHALQPESLKGLGFLGSIYTDEGAWKNLRQRGGTVNKRDD